MNNKNLFTSYLGKRISLRKKFKKHSQLYKGLVRDLKNE